MAADITDSRWTRLPDDGPHRVFTRALGSTEASFYWDGAFCGTADVVERHTVRVAPCLTCADPALDAARFRAVWMALKRRFPLLAARVEESDRGDTLRFVVSESRMDEKRDGTLDLDEFEFFADASAEDVEAVLQRGLNSPVRRLSQGRLGALSVLRRTDQPEGTYDVVSVIAHAITDGMSSFSFGRTMCDLLARWPSSLGDPIPRLEEALAMVPSSESLLSSRHQPLARRRWRMAAARIINAHRVEQLVGGQTIPRTFSELTSRTPAVSRKLHFALPSDVSSAAVAACRAHGVTIGHTLPVLGQVALSRMMHRRLARGELSLDEWEQRKLGPTMTGGPLNLRPILDPEWIKRGGFDATGVFIGFFFETLPCIPRAPLRDPADETSIDTDSSGAPPLRVLLPRGRFWLRAAMGKRTGDRYHRHPLFPEMVEDFAGGRIERVSGAVDIWRRVCRGEDVPVQPIPEIRGVMTHGGSSIGKIEHFLPREYPLRKSPSDPQREPTLLRLNSSTHLRCRPAELYLGTSMTGGALHYYIFYDANVYEDAVVEEWFEEIRGAIMHFLSGDEMEGRLVDEARSSTAKL